jgi:zinc transporter ZupT
MACGGFIYIACADLIPELHRQKDIKTSSIQTALLFLGIIVIWLVRLFSG